MSHDQDEEFIRQIEVHGIECLEKWTPERALSVLRENRRRYAHEPWMQSMSQLGEKLAAVLAQETGLSPADISTVLLNAGAKLGSLSLLHPAMPGKCLAEIMQCAADDLDQQAKAGEQP